ncbi:MAG: endonuclease/exonuclease/phosphatase family protein [Verrucomicrobia bacterium]|nr:endonuclease/exonuclease/phosphatase family protein [Verrucomicrobiota bacterium]MDA1005293.1 endonuclease/exonuclease/phosphatase family protein [Verrucomicrobiota bacterium]
MYRPRRKAFGVSLVVISLGFHLVTMALYTRQPDMFAAFTLFPVWIWGGLGLFLSSCAFLFFRAPLALFTSGVWALSILALADETRSLGRIGHPSPEPGTPQRHDGRVVIRVASINWSSSTASFSADIEEYQPDIIFIQEIPHPYRLRQLNDSLYQGKGDYRYDAEKSCGIIVRGEIERQFKNQVFRSQQVTARLPNGRRVELINLHLQAASTDLRLWSRDCWRTHRRNRALRRIELSVSLDRLKNSSDSVNRPAIIAGDFNAPANDSVYRMLGNRFVDSFDASGTGWGNTYHRRLPILRLDHIFVSREFLPVRSTVVSIPESDHRMVVSDLILK